MTSTQTRRRYPGIGRIGRLIAALALGALAGAPASQSGDTLDLEDYVGKVVVVDFWASWCVPCRRSFPWLDDMQSKYADDGLVVIGVNVDSDAAEARAFLEKYPVSFRIVEDPDGDLAKEFGVIAMPSSFVIGRDGEIVSKHLGFKVRETGRYEAVLRDTLDAD